MSESVHTCTPQIVFRDAHLLLCVKPAGLPSQPDASGQVDLLTLLMAENPAVKLTHRLDTPTGGMMVYGLSKAATGKLSQLVQDHTAFRKEYLAIVGKPPKVQEGELTDYLFHDKRQNKSFVADSARKGAKSAKLQYRTLAVNQDGCALLLVRLFTGRTHQIRVQFASRGMPLVGDGKYGSREKVPFIGLWSYRMSFDHPITSKSISAVSIPPANEKPWLAFADQLCKMSSEEH